METPAIEYTDALGKFLPDQDRPNEGVFSFQDDDEQWLSLRYDLTAPLARYVAENFDTLPKPYRSYRAGYVFRNEKPGPGRFRQFMQFDADTVGSASLAADAEMCMMAADTMEALGIPRGSYVVKVNNRKVLDGVLEAIGLGGEENAGKRLTVLRAIDKLDRLGVEGVRLVAWKGSQGRERRLHERRGVEARIRPNILHYCQLIQLDYLRLMARVVHEDERDELAFETETRRTERHAAASSATSIADRLANSLYQRGTDELAEIASLTEQPDTATAASASIRPSSAASNTTPARSTRWNSPSPTTGEDGRPSASARSAAAAATTASCRAFAASRCRRPASRSACRACSRRSPTSARSTPSPSPARWSSPCSTATVSPTTSAWPRRCAPPASAPSFISAPASSARR